MALAPIYIPVAPAKPARFGLLDTIGVKESDKAGMGVQYESEFCGTARPYSAMCVTLDLGSVSISVNNARQATITSTGLPDGTYRIVWGDGNTTASEAEQLNEAHVYAADGTYTVQVYGNGVTGYAEVDITVTNGVTSGPFAEDVVETKVPDDGITTVIGEPFPVYHLFTCRMPGSVQEGEERATRSFDNGASRAVEEGFQNVIGTGAVDVTPSGTAVSMVKGLALLEQYAGENYAGQPVIHMSRAQAILLMRGKRLVQVGDHYETGLGSLVVIGAGYDSHASLPSAPAATAGWMYATGQVNIWQSRPVMSGVVPNNPYDNEYSVLVERVYVPTYECFHAAVEVTESE